MSTLAFKNVTEFGHSLLSDQLEVNLQSYLQWCMLGIGGFSNVSIPSSGAYGGNEHQLRRVAEPNYIDGQVWEGFRKDWVWETGISYSAQPIDISGVFVNDTFQPVTGAGTYAHHINYPLGRVIFDTAIATTSTVTCEYSYRFYQVETADVQWHKELQFNSFRVDHPHFLQSGSGAWSILGQKRVQLPTIVIEAIPRTNRFGHELGNLTQNVRQDVLFHIYAEDRYYMNKAHDILTHQEENTFIGFDINRMIDSGVFPLDWRGMRVDEAKIYPDFIRSNSEGGYGWREIRFAKMNGMDYGVVSPLHYAVVRGSMEVLV